MSFDELVNVKMPEVEIFDRVAEILQRNFHKYQDVNVVLPLDEMDGELCSIKEVRLYSRHDAEQVEAKREYMMGGPNYKAYVITKYYDCHHSLCLSGHFACKYGDVYSNKILVEHTGRFAHDRTKRKTMPRVVFEGAFGELTAALSRRKSA